MKPKLATQLLETMLSILGTKESGAQLPALRMRAAPALPKESLKERILKAQSSDEITTLLMEGNTFRKATLKTRRSWNAAAQRRVRELATQGRAVA